MPVVATTKDTAPAAIGASRSVRSWALIAPWIGSAAPAATASASQPVRSRTARVTASAPAWVRTITAAPATTATAPAT